MNTSSAMPCPAPIRRFAIVGGRGQMGQLFLSRAAALGLEGTSLDRPLAALPLAERLRGLDMLLLSVPVGAFDETLALLVPHLDGKTILADVCSVKLLPLLAMRKAYAGPVVGTHPLFGPEPPPGARVAIAAGRDQQDEDAARRVTAFFESMGFPCFPTTAEAHDKAMAAVQNLNFVTTVAYLAALAPLLGEGDDDADLRQFLTPSLQRRLDAARKMCTQDAALFTALFDANPYSMDLVRRYRNYLHVAAGGDLELLVNQAGQWWEHAP